MRNAALQQTPPIFHWHSSSNVGVLGFQWAAHRKEPGLVKPKQYSFQVLEKKVLPKLWGHWSFLSLEALRKHA